MPDAIDMEVKGLVANTEMTRRRYLVGAGVSPE